MIIIIFMIFCMYVPIMSEFKENVSEFPNFEALCFQIEFLSFNFKCRCHALFLRLRYASQTIEFIIINIEFKK